VTDKDRADARALLGLMIDTGFSRRAILDENRMSDHLGPGYDPNRVVRILTALRDILPKEIESWKYWRLSRATAEKYWEEYLLGEHCSRCEQPGHGCRALADALGYERVEHKNGRRTWHRHKRKPPTG
jgi:hypothetical protein